MEPNHEAPEVGSAGSSFEEFLSELNPSHWLPQAPTGGWSRVAAWRNRLMHWRELGRFNRLRLRSATNRVQGSRRAAQREEA